MKASTKYLNRKCHFIRQIVEDEEIEVLHVPSEEMKADHLTKSVDAVKIKNCLSGGVLPNYWHTKSPAKALDSMLRKLYGGTTTCFDYLRSHLNI
ncbi:hypothetical protein LAZ67_9003302 [Cordylochernes scorpioides]|uniref:Uncharacterized protein n=1 Tax=Cordylochernes scorpioides TaxID=51811 RepID=A0ABY6KV12_9ARAC|nr:hypothetical protein LAZ67_9003302 [Cordylochernes scorpioides]